MPEPKILRSLVPVPGTGVPEGVWHSMYGPYTNRKVDDWPGWDTGIEVNQLRYYVCPHVVDRNPYAPRQIVVSVIARPVTWPLSIEGHEYQHRFLRAWVEPSIMLIHLLVRAPEPNGSYGPPFPYPTCIPFLPVHIQALCAVQEEMIWWTNVSRETPSPSD